MVIDNKDKENVELTALIDEYLSNFEEREIRHILDPIWDNKILSLLTTNDIQGEQDRKMAKDEIWMTMVGVTSIEDFKSRIKNKIKLPGGGVDRLIEKSESEVIIPFLLKISADAKPSTLTERQQKPNIEQTKFEKTFSSQPTTKKININEKSDPYLEPIEESDKI